MIVSEAEARDKLCPIVAVTVMLGVQAKHAGAEVEWRDPRAGNCMASECMMWRFHQETADGYCGLAGKPDYLP